MNNTAVQSAVSTVKQIVEATCRHPNMMQFYHEDTGTEVVMRIKVHPADSRRLVGARADNIKALRIMARLMLWGTGRLANIQQIEWHDVPEGDYEPFNLKADWQEPKLTNLIETMAFIVFHERCKAITKPVENNDEMTKIIVNVPVNDNRPKTVATDFDKAAKVLFVPIGINHGRRLHIETRTE